VPEAGILKIINLP